MPKRKRANPRGIGLIAVKLTKINEPLDTGRGWFIEPRGVFKLEFVELASPDSDACLSFREGTWPSLEYFYIRRHIYKSIADDHVKRCSQREQKRLKSALKAIVNPDELIAEMK